jgi:hypothetical protein
MKHNDVRDAVTRVFAEAGIAYRMRHRGKHPFLNFDHNGKSVKVWLPVSPSDVRSVQNARAFARRLLRQLRG